MLLFFFQAEDGIRGIGVTGVQTCALPISHGLSRKIARGFFEFAPEFVVIFWSAGEADNLDGWREIAIGGEVIQCGNKFAMSEIARGSKYHNCAWLRHGARG